MVPRKQAAVVAAMCLLAGLGLGFVFGDGALSSPSAASEVAASIEPLQKDDSPSADSHAAPLAASTDAAVASADPALADPALAAPGRADAALADPATATTIQKPDTAVEVTVGEPGQGECALEISVFPEDALISIGGTALAAGVKRVNLPCGVRPLGIAHAKYKNHNGKIALNTGKVTKLEHRLKRATIILRVLSTPKGALVSFNSDDVGRTPLKRRVPAFEAIELRLVRSGFRPHTQTVAPEAATTLNIRMRKRRKRRRAGNKKRSPGRLKL